jgi:uncharacterized protein DUF3105
MGAPRRALAIAAVTAAVPLVLAGCGGGGSGGGSTSSGSTSGSTTSSGGGVVAYPGGPILPNLPDPKLDDTNRFPRPSTVGDGNGAAPPIDAAVTAAATAVGCTTQSFPGEGRNHVAPDKAPQYGQQPPTSGNHFQVPAKWGVYDKPLPDMLAVHNLDHGATIIYIGTKVPAAARQAIGDFWAASPPYVVVAPGVSQGFPANGVVVTSWQRWLVCKDFTAKKVSAIKAYRDAYRGTGPESIAALHAPGSVPFPNAPEPLVEDPGAEQG